MPKPFDRVYYWLVDYIRRTSPTLKQLDEAWMSSPISENRGHLNRRNFQYWKKVLGDTYGIEIKCRTRGREYRYYIDEKPRERKVTDWLSRTISVQNTITENLSIHDRIVLEDIPSGDNYLQDILSAVKENLCISFTYTDYWEDTVKVTMMPYFVRLFHQRWYVIGPLTPSEKTGPSASGNDKRKTSALRGRAQDDTIRSYALDSDRMSEFTLTEIRFTYPEDFDPEDFYVNNMSTLTEPLDKLPVQIVRILVWEKQNFYIRNVKLHASQEEELYCMQDGYSIFKYRIQPTYDFIMALRACGNDIEVLSPRWLREEMMQGAKDVLDEYAGKSRATCRTKIDVDE